MASSPWLAREANLRMEVRSAETHAGGNPTIYLNYIGPLQGALSSRFLKVDVSRDETMIFPLETKPLHGSYTDCHDRKSSIKVYSPEEILAEKLRCILTRTEPRDLYDIHYMLTNRMVDVEKTWDGMAPKFEAKDLAVADLRLVLERRRATFRQMWGPRLAGQVPEIPEFEGVIRETNRVIQNYT